MVLNAADVMVGAAAGVVAEQANKLVAKIRKEEEKRDNPWRLLEEIRDYLRVMAEKENLLLPAHNVPMSLQPYPYVYEVGTHVWAHVCLFLASGISGSSGAYLPKNSAARLYIEIPGGGTHIRSVKAGWTQLDLPVGTTLSTADGNNYPVIISYRNDVISDDITEPLSLLTSTSSATSTGVNTDQTVTFASEATLTEIANNSSNTIVYNLNSATTAGSDALSAGQKIFFQDIAVNTVHLQATNDTPINGSAGSNIVVQGWA